MREKVSPQATDERFIVLSAWPPRSSAAAVAPFFKPSPDPLRGLPSPTTG